MENPFLDGMTVWSEKAVTREEGKTIRKPVGKVVVENLFLYGMTVWSEKVVTREKDETIRKPVGKVVVENLSLDGNVDISIWKNEVGAK